MSGAVAIVGATSPIGRAVARAFAAQGRSLIVTGRDDGELERTAADLRTRYRVSVDVHVLDAGAVAELAPWWRRLASAGAEPEGLVLCWGDMPEQADAERDADRLAQMVTVNVSASLVLLEAAAATMAARRHGFLCAITSVAGDRGRPSNYLYGATKAALSTALSGLRARLAAHGVPVLDVRPGFVDTGLTWGRPGVFLAAPPERVAAAAVRGLARRRAVVYTPFFWRFVMLAIRSIPEPLFRRLPL